MDFTQRFRLLPVASLCFFLATTLCAQKPAIFDISEVVIGAQRIKTLYFSADGRWSDADPHVGMMSTHVECYKALGFCAMASADWHMNQAFVQTYTYDILRWDAREIVAEDSSPICVINSLRVDIGTKRVTLSSTDKGITSDAVCKGSDKLPTAVLTDGRDAISSKVH